MATDARDLAVALARKGFRDGEVAVMNLRTLGDVPDDLLEQITSVASPDTALASLQLDRLADGFRAAADAARH
ncbi:hypothetical protein [Aeromicrobium sp. UC242_57]|uniref:hypothetical protein n=1 Tax=Aeromicrobium sp. UC242_57 TaxID=3374624 RepID=UPI0037B07E95